MPRDKETLGRRPPPPTGSSQPPDSGSRGGGEAVLGLLGTGLGDPPTQPLSPGPWAPDCFFQLGNLTFAEADYQQALALSPQDEGANMRMGLLQEKMGFCEQRSRCATRGRAQGGAAGVGWGGPGSRLPTGTLGRDPLLSQARVLSNDFSFQESVKNCSLFSRNIVMVIALFIKKKKTTTCVW